MATKEKCAVQIVVRERPVLNHSDLHDQISILREENNIYVEGRCFAFDRVLGPSVSQEEMYESVVAPLIDKAKEGFHCTILAYGQSGTGKSYTMGLNEEQLVGLQSGMVSRSLAESFQLNDKFQISISFIEIYNEKAYDLLAEVHPLQSSAKKLFSNGFIRRPAYNLCEAHTILKEGIKNRHVRPTKMNALSSRSHAIFTIHLVSEHIKSSINLVDLAGSEGVRRTGHQGVALAEGVNINQGLLSVGKVLQALASGNKMIPYRDSVLSFALKDSLNTNSYFTLVACISSLSDDFSETMATLRFALDSKSLRSAPQINIVKNSRTPNKQQRYPLSLNNSNYTPQFKKPRITTSTVFSTSKNRKMTNHTFSTPNKCRRIENSRQNHTTLGLTPNRQQERSSACSSLFEADSLNDNDANHFFDISSSTSIGDPQRLLISCESRQSQLDKEIQNLQNATDCSPQYTKCCDTPSAMSQQLEQLLTKVDRIEKTFDIWQNLQVVQSFLQENTVINQPESIRLSSKNKANDIRNSVDNAISTASRALTFNSQMVNDESNITPTTFMDYGQVTVIENTNEPLICSPVLTRNQLITENVEVLNNEQELSNTVDRFKVPHHIPLPSKRSKFSRANDTVTKRRSQRIASMCETNPLSVNTKKTDKSIRSEEISIRRNSVAETTTISINDTVINAPKRRSIRIASMCDTLSVKTVKKMKSSTRSKGISIRSVTENLLQTTTATVKKSSKNFMNQQMQYLSISKETQTKKQAMENHKKNILKMLNIGDMATLKVLPMIGPKTAYALITHRSLNGKFKSIDDVSKLPIWRGQLWNSFLVQNNLT